MHRFRFPTVPVTTEEKDLRREVRAFLSKELESGGFVPQADAWMSGVSPDFSRKLGEHGWI